MWYHLINFVNVLLLWKHQRTKKIEYLNKLGPGSETESSEGEKRREVI